MIKFIYFKSKKPIKEHIPAILEIITEALSIIKYENDSNSLIIYYTYTNVSIYELANIIVTELYEDIIIYESINYKNENEANDALTIVKEIIAKGYTKDIYLDNKKLLMANIGNINEKLRMLVLNTFYNDKEMYNTLKVFLENNQNVTTSANILYLHRNTLNQRLAKFEEVTTFNIKNFIDGYLIYHLLK